MIRAFSLGKSGNTLTIKILKFLLGMTLLISVSGCGQVGETVIGFMYKHDEKLAAEQAAAHTALMVKVRAAHITLNWPVPDNGLAIADSGDGLDIDCPPDTTILASAAGQVHLDQPEHNPNQDPTVAGKWLKPTHSNQVKVTIEHDPVGYATTYSASFPNRLVPLVKQGQSVQVGDPIARLEQTRSDWRVSLLFQISYQGALLDPLDMLVDHRGANPPPQ